MLLSSTWARLLCNILAYLYPAYMTFKAIQGTEKDAHGQWLTYWIVNSYFTVGEIVGDNVLAGIPLYYEVKVALLLWLVTPRFNGANKIYKHVIQPYLIRYEADIDESLNSIQQQGVEGLGALREAGLKNMQAGGGDLLKMGQQAMLTGLLSAAGDRLNSGFSRSEAVKVD